MQVKLILFSKTQSGLGSSIILPKEVSIQKSSCLSSSSQMEGSIGFGLSGIKGWKVEVVLGIEDEDRLEDKSGQVLG